MRIGTMAVGVVMTVLGATGTAAAQVETQQPDERAAAPAKPAAPPAPPATPASEQPTTISLAMPAHKLELSGRLGVIGGGEIRPKGWPDGHMQAAPVGSVDFDYIVHPFFTIGLYGTLTHADFELYSNNVKTNADASMTLVSLGTSIKGRIPLSEALTAKVGIYAGYNLLSFSASGGGKKLDASGGGVNLGLGAELSYTVSHTVALNVQAGFLSQVTGSVTVDGSSNADDLAFKPKPFVMVGPQFRF